GKVASFEASKAKAVPGVRDVFEIKTSGRGASTTGGVAILADNSWAAIQGRKALAVKWEEGAAANESSEELNKQFLDKASTPGKNHGAYHADGRWLWPALSGRFCDGSGASCQDFRQTGHGPVDPRR